eukprot:5596064-Lingulodinium_polyedra.AAC.1
MAEPPPQAPAQPGPMAPEDFRLTDDEMEGPDDFSDFGEDPSDAPGPRGTDPYLSAASGTEAAVNPLLAARPPRQTTLFEAAGFRQGRRAHAGPAAHHVIKPDKARRKASSASPPPPGREPADDFIEDFPELSPAPEAP